MDETTPPPKKPKGKPRGSQFQKGDDPRRAVGNNARRTKSGQTVTSLAREFTEEALMKQVEIMRDPTTPKREQLKASEHIISRGWGAAKQSIEMTASVGHEDITSRVNWDAVSLEAKINLLQHIQTLPAPDMTSIEADYTVISQENDDSED